MDKKSEVEFRAFISQETFDSMLVKGRSAVSTNFKGPMSIEDAYFCSKSVRSFNEIEMDEVGSYSLRLRNEVRGTHSDVSLNTKVIQAVGDHNAWLEHETRVTSFEDTVSILGDIGFKKFFVLKKNRYSFDNEGVHVCLESIESFQPAIEVEIITSQEKSNEAKTALLAYLEKNGIAKDQIVKKSITNLLMRKLAKF